MAPARTCTTVSCARESITDVVVVCLVSELLVCPAGVLLFDYVSSADHKFDARCRVGEGLPVDTGCRFHILDELR